MGVAKPPFQVLIDHHGRDVLRFLSASVGPIDADDCYQETFLSALRAYPRLVDSSNLRAWLLTIASRKAIDFHRARARGPLPVEEVPEQGHTEGAEPDDGVWQAVRSLPPKQRAAVVFRFANDLGYAEIGGALDCSEEAARRSVFEGLRTLRAQTARGDVPIAMVER
jgi:RNA polymerase sigma factor (sigma-70 family)